MTQAEAGFGVKASIFAWGTIRDMVKEAQFNGYDVRLFESSGLLSRRFMITGDKTAVVAIKERLVKAKEQALL